MQISISNSYLGALRHLWYVGDTLLMKQRLRWRCSITSPKRRRLASAARCWWFERFRQRASVLGYYRHRTLAENRN